MSDRAKKEGEKRGSMLYLLVPVIHIRAGTYCMLYRRNFSHMMFRIQFIQVDVKGRKKKLGGKKE